MRDPLRKSAQKHRVSPSPLPVRVALRALHHAIEGKIIDPTDRHHDDVIEECCALIWQWASTVAREPWGLCLDRYCGCKVALSEHEPERLDGGAWNRPMLGQGDRLYPTTP